MFLNSMSAEEIARTLGGRRVGRDWMARCPAHRDRTPSLAITQSDNRVLVHCHAGCSQRAVIAALRRCLWGSANIDKWQIVRELDLGRPIGDVGKRKEAGLAIWKKATDPANSVVEAYLRNRGIVCELPQSLRYFGNLKHPSGNYFTAMIALVTRGIDGVPVAIHRTFLNNGGVLPEPAKMMLGPCRGGAVRLGEPGDLLLVSEGIETGLSAMQATGLPVWAALSTSGLRSLELPRSVTEVIVIADGDDPGETAAVAAAQRWKAEGRAVRIARPPRGLDFNDVLHFF